MRKNNAYRKYIFALTALIGQESFCWFPQMRNHFVVVGQRAKQKTSIFNSGLFSRNYSNTPTIVNNTPATITKEEQFTEAIKPVQLEDITIESFKDATIQEKAALTFNYFSNDLKSKINELNISAEGLNLYAKLNHNVKYGVDSLFSAKKVVAKLPDNEEEAKQNLIDGFAQEVPGAHYFILNEIKYLKNNPELIKEYEKLAPLNKNGELEKTLDIEPRPVYENFYNSWYIRSILNNLASELVSSADNLKKRLPDQEKEVELFLNNNQDIKEGQENLKSARKVSITHTLRNPAINRDVKENVLLKAAFGTAQVGHQLNLYHSKNKIQKEAENVFDSKLQEEL